MPRYLPHAILIAVIALLAIISLHVGIRFTPSAEVWRALSQGGDDQAALIVNTLRVPRTAVALIVGGALGLAGLLLQTATRNPLAEPGLLGINAGAGFAVVLLVVFTGTGSLSLIALAACLGALLCALLVFSLAFSAGGISSPSYLLLAGVTIAALLSSGIQIVIVADERTMEELIFWLSGGFADRDAELLYLAAPVVVLVAVACRFLAPTLDALMTDDTTAEALGVPVLKVRMTVLVLAAILAGVSVSVAGPVAFIGLAAPHLARLSGFPGHRQLVPLSLLAGSALALAADIAARFIIYPSEAPVGVLLAVVGVPMLLYLLQRKRLGAAA
ncbi:MULTISPECIES: iron ABC transporter permease [Nitratireductor]|uniref:FecCD family ABC transporter permease n=1 Tax=Nitratireductor TaxID=245876 RepID=UPI000DE1836B|nr:MULTISPECIES: iron ABC transporter permease [Nitratireductor]MBN7762496.1 iron ABC transporter permease [Nitratireductor aquibiodomus]MCV0379153.1 iron ABC transporter permease [Nitratireductor sp.]